MVTSMWQSFVKKIKQSLRSANIIRLKSPGKIHPNAKVKDVVLTGKVTIDEYCRLIDGVTVVADSEVTIGRYTTINGPATDIYAAIHPVSIGNFCSIARHVSVQEYHHRTDRLTTYFIGKNLFRDATIKDTYSKGPVVIGNDVWIGAHSIILSGVTIGNGAVIGANSVVTGDIPPYAIASGSPAKVIRYRFSDDIIHEIQKLNWWDWPYEKIMANKQLFSEAITPEMTRAIS
jgi:virginiamycin A acetyltransferase